MDTNNLQSSIRTQLRSMIKGRIFVKLEEKTNDEKSDFLYVSISNSGVHYDTRLTIDEGVYKLIKENQAYVKTLANLVFDGYKKYVDTKFFVFDKTKSPKMKENKKREKT